MEDVGRRSEKEQTIRDSGLKIPHEMFDGLQMEGGGLMHELRDFVDDKGDVGTGE